MSKNELVLRRAGLIGGGELADEIARFIEELDDQEIEVLIRLKQRLDEAEIPTEALYGGVPLF